MNLNKLVRAAIFAAMAIGLGFMFMLVPNLEFISVTVFLAGLTLGISYGAMVGGTAMLIYSVMNPLGSGLIYLTKADTNGNLQKCHLSQKRYLST